MKTKKEKNSASQLKMCRQFVGCSSHKQLAMAAFEYEDMLYEQGWQWSKKKLSQVKAILENLYSLMRRCDRADLEGRYKQLYPKSLKSYFPMAREIPIKQSDTPWVEEFIFKQDLQLHLEQLCG